MWLNDVILSTMFQEKVKNQRMELEKARERNKELVQRCKVLEEEHNYIDERLEDSQVNMVLEKNNLNSLLQQLKLQRKINLDQSHRLQISNEQLEMLQSQIEKTQMLNKDSMCELKPIREKLSFKWDVVDCLEKLLVSTRLQTAEQEEVLAELKKQKSELDKDVAMMRDVKPSSVSTWQEEFLDARLKEADVNLEFEKIKRDLSLLKKDVTDALEESKRVLEEEGTGERFSIKFNIRDRYQEQLKAKEECAIIFTNQLKNEEDRLRLQIRELQQILEDMNKQFYFNEDIKLHLYEVRSSIFQRLERTNYELEKQIEKNKKIEEKMNEELKSYQEKINKKDEEIQNLLRKITELQSFIEISTRTSEESMSLENDATVSLLENMVHELEQRIDSLQKNSEINVPTDVNLQ